MSVTLGLERWRSYDPLSRWLRSGRRALLIAVALAALQAGLLLHTAYDKSDTIDEGTYLAAAALWAVHGDDETNREAPMLAKRAFAAALALVDDRLHETPPDFGGAEHWVLYDRGLDALRRNLLAARLTTIVATVLGGLLLWLAARRFGDGPAALTHGLYVLSPPILAHGALATLDGWLVAATCAFALALARFVERPTRGRGTVVGAAIGVACAAKAFGLGLWLPAVLLGVPALRARSAAKWSAFATAGLLAILGSVLAIWAVYGFRFTEVRVGVGPLSEGLVATTWPLPAGAWIEGVLWQLSHAGASHPSYLFGEAGEGWWWFFLAALALRTPIAAQVLVAARVFGSVRRQQAAHSVTDRGADRWLLDRYVDVALLSFPACLLIVTSGASTQLGLRYLLAGAPLVFLWLGRLLGDGANWRRAKLAAGCVLVLAIETAAAHPHHLMSFNRWAGGPEGGPRYLIVGADWGQDVARLARWQRDAGVDEIYFTHYAGSPTTWGVRSRPPPCRPTDGVYAIHAIEAHRPRFVEPGCLDWLLVELPDERLGYSIYIYEVDAERRARLEASTRQSPFWR